MGIHSSSQHIAKAQGLNPVLLRCAVMRRRFSVQVPILSKNKTRKSNIFRVYF